MVMIKKVQLGLGMLFAAAILSTHPGPAAAQNIGMVCTEQAGSPARIDLVATSDYIQTPDGNSVFMWGFGLNDSANFQIPGPVVCVNQGDVVRIRLTNQLPEPISLVFPGQRNVRATEISGGPSSDGLLTLQADPGGMVQYLFRASQPGTYLYESGSMRHKQVHMGLYGVIVVRPSMGSEFAYNEASTEFSDEFVLVLHEFDPDLHRAVELGGTFDQTTRHDRYWTINGRSNPDVVNDNGFPLMPKQPYSALVRVEAQDPEASPDVLPVLIRLVNAGTVNHPFHPHGNHMQVIAQDGRLLGGAERRTFSNTLAAGQTLDMLFEWRNVENWKVCMNPPCTSTSGAADVDESEGPVPVEIPGLQNLVFKDDVTFYSGNAHLGFTGTLPPAVTSFGECGEMYFPWHSHALQTVQNFDEGFGGMLTLVRVDPPGGCP